MEVKKRADSRSGRGSEPMSVHGAGSVPVLVADKVSKSYGHTQVLRDADFSVQQGEVKAILGRSGSGKSTLLRCLALLELPDSGNVWFQGERLGRRPGSDRWLRETQRARQRRPIGMVFQRFNLFPHLTALENVTIGPRTIEGAGEKESVARAMEELQHVDMAPFAHRYPSELSGGQQQRVAIARALALSPKVMLFDEPTSALDPELVGGVLRVMERLASEGMTMVVVTHEVRFARHVADSVVMFHDGAIVEEGPPASFFDSPRHEQTRGFLEHVL